MKRLKVFSVQVGIPWRLNSQMNSNGILTSPGEYGFTQGASSHMNDPRETQAFLPLNITQNPSAGLSNHYENHSTSFLPQNLNNSNATVLSNSHNKNSQLQDSKIVSKSGSPKRGCDLEPGNSPSPQLVEDTSSTLNKKQRRRVRRKPVNKPIDVSKIDLYSRIMFPLTYIMICIIYWMVYIGVTGLTQNSFEQEDQAANDANNEQEQAASWL